MSDGNRIRVLLFSIQSLSFHALLSFTALGLLGALGEANTFLSLNLAQALCIAFCHMPSSAAYSLRL